jgi:hypothetical protein
MKNVFMLLTLVSLSACSEEQPNLTQQQANSSDQKEVIKLNDAGEGDKTDWDNAKHSTQQALQDIWDASKETSQTLIEEGSANSKEWWQSGKQKSSELWQQGKENSIDIWNDIESGSKETWSQGKDKIEELFPKQSEPTDKSIDEI